MRSPKKIFWIFLFASFIIAFIVGGFFLGASKNKTIDLDAKDNKKTISLHVGESLRITLTNPGDGGYQFAQPQYNNSLINQVKHEHISPKETAQMVGNFGSDYWVFKAIKSGETSLSIDIFRPWEQYQQINTFKIDLKILP